jgi:hypothetical protein
LKFRSMCLPQKLIGGGETKLPDNAVIASVSGQSN